MLGGRASQQTKPPAGAQIDWSHPFAGAANLRGYWLFSEGSGSRVNDLCSQTPLAVGGTASWQGRGLKFGSGGSTAYASLGRNFGEGATTLSPFSWTLRAMQITADGSTKTVILGRNDGTRIFQIEFSTFSGWGIRVAYGVSPFDSLAWGGTVVSGRWYDIAFTFSGAGVGKLYVNGNLVASDSSPTGSFASATTEYRIGQRGGDNSYGFDGLIDSAAFYGSELSPDAVKAIAANPYGVVLPPVTRRAWFLPTSATNYTLTAAAGSFSLSGQAASLRAARVVTAAAGSFALAGQPATLKAARKVTASAGRFSLNTSGEAVYTTPGTYYWTVPAGVTAITVEGIGCGGRGASVNDGYQRGGGGGAYARSTAVAVTPGESLVVSIDNPAGLGSDENGPVYLLREATQLLYAVGGDGFESGASGGYIGNCVYNDVVYSGGDGAYGSASGSGGGGGAGLTGAGANASGATPGAGGSGNPGTGTGGGSPGWDGQSYGGGGGSPQTGYADPDYRPIGGGGWLRITWTGNATAGLRADRKVTAAAGSFAMAGQDAGLRAARIVTASVGTFTLTGQDASLRAARTLTAAVGAFTLTGQAAGLSVGRTLVGGCGVFGVTGQDAGLRVARTLAAGAGAFAVTGYAAGLRWSDEPAVIPDARWSNRSRSVAYAAPGRDVRWEPPNRTPTWEPPP